MKPRARAAVPLALLLVGFPPAAAAPGGASAWLAPPVDGPITDRFVAPTTEYGPGHRGIDYDVTAGTPVRAASSGTVTFAGPVGGHNAITIAHEGDLETTYSFLSEVHVTAGDLIEEGRWLGLVDEAHPGEDSGLHFGVKSSGHYIDPELKLGPVDVSAAIYLTPTVYMPDENLTPAWRDAFSAGTSEQPCSDPRTPGPRPIAPNQNVAVALAGISSRTTRGEAPTIYTQVPGALGYDPVDTYRFSYRGHQGRTLHQPYERTHTYRDLRFAADRLRDLMIQIGERHPGRAVDLIAHSQGGLVARTYLKQVTSSWDARLPRVEHLLTFASPHTGASLAEGLRDVGSSALTGPMLLDAASDWAQREGPLPDPHAPAVAQLTPGSDLLEALGREDVTFGTRVLALGIPDDLMVTADRARYPGKTSRIVPPHLRGWAHAGILESAAARALAHSFLRGAPDACPGRWDVWGPRLGKVLGWGESKAGWALSAVEGAVGGAVAKRAGSLLRRAWKR